MQVDRSKMLKLLKGRRIAIPLLAAGVALFVVFGGHRAIVSFAMDGMTGFLAGTAGGAEDAVPKPAPDAHPGVPVVAVAQEPQGEVFLAQVQLLAETAPVEVQVAQTESLAATPEPPADSTAAAPMPAAAEPTHSDTSVRKLVSAYTASFLRDPFYSLVQAGKDRPARLLDVGRAKMVGSVWGESGIIALLEDDSGRSYALKVGDKVLDGRAISVTPASVTFTLTMFGLTKTVTLELAEEGE